MREVNLVNDNERTLLRYVVEGDIRKSQQQAKIVLEGLTTVKDKAFKETCLRTLASKSPTLIELPYNLQGLFGSGRFECFPRRPVPHPRRRESGHRKDVQDAPCCAAVAGDGDSLYEFSFTHGRAGNRKD